MKLFTPDTILATQIPTNIITGFLGAGKTTTILHLLANKPVHEEWAVLVNEFGETGIDGALLERTGVNVREIPGGCMCCTNGLPMQIGLNFLLARKPDRLIIEPSGLGHAREVLNILSSEFYEKTVRLEATITLVNPAKLSDKRYLEHDIFKDQLTVADVLIANKTDLCSPEDKAAFQKQANTQDYLATDWVTGGQINPEYLSYPNRIAELKRHTEQMKDEKPQGAGHQPRLLNSPLLKNEPYAMPVAQFSESHTTEIQRSENSDGTFFSYGWVFPESTVLATRSIMDLLYRVQPLRAKGLLNTEEGFKVFQCSDGTVSVMSSDQGNDSRIEIIHNQPLSAKSLEAELLANSQLPGPNIKY